MSVAHVASRARVSTATFYEQFQDREDGLLAAYRTVVERILGQTRLPSGTTDWSDGARKVLAPLLNALQSDPDAGRVLFVEALAGVACIREERRLVLEEFGRRVEASLDGPPKDGNTPDIPAVAVMGALRNIVSRHLRTHAEDRLPLLVEDGLTWVGSYATPAGQKRWSIGPHALLPATSAYRHRPVARGPARLPRGRHSLPAGVVARSHRERILRGTAEAMMAKGYAHATVADIVAQAGVSRDVFYEHFSDKQHAFLEAQQHPTQYVLDACATAYFSAREWPERVWRCYETLLGLIAANPAVSHLRLVDCYDAGPAAIRRAEEITRSFTFFLEEGYSYRPQARQLPRLCSEAIAGAIFEIIQRSVAHGDVTQTPRQLPLVTYIAIAPFTGPQDAIRLIERFSGPYLSA